MSVDQQPARGRGGGARDRLAVDAVRHGHAPQAPVVFRRRGRHCRRRRGRRRGRHGDKRDQPRAAAHRGVGGAAGSARPAQPGTEAGLADADATAIGEPFYQGTIITYSAHAAIGRNARTGAVMWSYTRTDRVVCTVSQQQGHTLAIFAKDGNCDELTTLDTGTGKRLGVRTLVDNGHPTFTALPDTLLITTPETVHAIDPDSGYDRWLFQQPDGCRTAGAAIGAGGALIGQRCADGGHLLLRDRYASSDDKNTQVKWRLSGVDAIPLSAETTAIALNPSTGQLVSYDLTRGSVRSRTPLSPRPVAAAPSVAAGHDDRRADPDRRDRPTRVTPTGTSVLWTASTRGLPTVTGAGRGARPRAADVRRCARPGAVGARASSASTPDPDRCCDVRRSGSLQRQPRLPDGYGFRRRGVDDSGVSVSGRASQARPRRGAQRAADVRGVHLRAPREEALQ